MISLCYLVGSPDSPLCLLGFRGAIKKEYKLNKGFRQKSAFFRGKIAIHPIISRKPSQVLENIVPGLRNVLQIIERYAHARRGELPPTREFYHDGTTIIVGVLYSV